MLIGHFSQGARPVSEKVPGAQGAADSEMCVGMTSTDVHKHIIMHQCLSVTLSWIDLCISLWHSISLQNQLNLIEIIYLRISDVTVVTTI